MVDEGEGALARRLIPFKGSHLDPFVLFDDYEISPGAFFPEHPHGGFEGFQILKEGRTLYKDNVSNEGAIDPGDVRRFVAGKGFRHSEKPDAEGIVRGYLLWAKIPDRMKDTPIIFKEVSADRIPLRNENGMVVRTIIGGGSPVDSLSDILWEVVIARNGGRYGVELQRDMNGFIYVSSGSVDVEGTVIGGGRGLIFQRGNSYNLELSAGTEMVFIDGKMTDEKIVQEGHFVL